MEKWQKKIIIMIIIIKRLRAAATPYIAEGRVVETRGFRGSESCIMSFNTVNEK